MSLDRLLLPFGLGFLAANVRILAQFGLYLKRRRHALLVWPSLRPPFFSLFLAIGVVLGVLLVYNLAFLRPTGAQLFGEGMMFLYYAYLVRLKQRVRLGFYEDGIWAETAFVPYRQIDAISWHDTPQVTLIIVSRLRSLARRLVVPGDLYGAARRVLRERIAAHDIKLTGAGLELGLRDTSEDA